ncbi:MAG: VanW family protein [Zoogloeaceae bacterium]|nr:VanW family protein [Zoogloeaceae bacterium]
MRLRYLLKGYVLRMGRLREKELFDAAISVSQPIFVTATSANKIRNLRRAAEKISRFVFQPGDYLSFWDMIGEPSAKNGYLPGRNLVAGRLVEEDGGGLCQLSGILYHLGLKTGLRIVERSNHSVDLYRDAERFTPLGCDATVVYGYKNLLMQNTTDATLYFSFEVADDAITGRLHSDRPLTETPLRFELVEDNRRTVVETWAGREKIARSVYANYDKPA